MRHHLLLPFITTIVRIQTSFVGYASYADYFDFETLFPFNFFASVFLAGWFVSFFVKDWFDNGQFATINFIKGSILFCLIPDRICWWVKYNGPDERRWAGRLERYNLKYSTGHRDVLVANIFGMTKLFFSWRPLGRVLVIPSAKVTKSFPLSSFLNEKSSIYIEWCSCRSRKPKCWMNCHQIVLIREGVEEPAFHSSIRFLLQHVSKLRRCLVVYPQHSFLPFDYRSRQIHHL